MAYPVRDKHGLRTRKAKSVYFLGVPIIRIEDDE
jgi:hypothetical protein